MVMVEDCFMSSRPIFKHTILFMTCVGDALINVFHVGPSLVSIRDFFILAHLNFVF
jgi:hypothetical protein